MMMNAKTLSDTAIARWVLLRVAGVTSGPPGGKTEKNIQVEGKVNDDERRGTGYKVYKVYFVSHRERL